MPEQRRLLWIEPLDMTLSREGQVFCENCGEETPYHNNSCRLLKVAYTHRTGKCSFCPEMLPVGDQMYEHVKENHLDEVEALGYVLAKKT